MVDTPLSLAPATRQRILRDSRAVLDASEPDLADLGRGGWVVLRTEPAPHSGSATLAGVVLDGDTGQPSRSLDGPLTVVFEGDYQILEVLSGPARPGPGHYSWTEPLPATVRGLPRDLVYHPFGTPSVLVCQYDPAVPTGPFAGTHVLPEGWETSLAESARTPGEPDERTRADWLTSPNPLLFARAVGALSRAGRLDASVLRLLLDRATGYSRAVSHLAALRAADRPGGTALLATLDAEFATGAEPDRRRAAALALLTAKLFEPAATAAVLGDWTPRGRPGGLLDADVVAQDEYVGAAFTLLVPA